MKPIYFDNAATSWPKPPEMFEEMKHYNKFIGASPGRSGHSYAAQAGFLVFEVREKLADFFNIENPLQIIFTSNATQAINTAILGLFKPGDHLVTSSLEHNSVMRPLRWLEKKGVELSVLKCSSKGELNPNDLIPLIKKNTKGIIMTHASNVTGSILPITKIGQIAKKTNLLFGVDASQTAGVIPIDVQKMNIDFLAFTGHKSLLGPQGTGGLYFKKGLEKKISPLIRGGTGSKSELEEQPDFMPDKYESGTLNTIGLTGLKGSLNYLEKIGIETIRDKEKKLTKKFLEGLSLSKKIKIFGTQDVDKKTAVVSFNLPNYEPGSLAQILDENYKILSRPGLHCAPAAHQTIETFPKGTLRFSFSYFNTEKEIERALKGIEKLI